MFTNFRDDKKSAKSLADEGGVGGASDPGRPHFDAEDEDELKHRRLAVAKHRQRFFRQAVGATVAAALILFAPIYWRGFLMACGYDFAGPDWPLSSVERNFASLLSMFGEHMPYLIFVVLLAAPALYVWAFNIWLRTRYRFLRDKDYELRAAEAESNEPKTSAFGYMGVFRLYAKTKRRAVFMLLNGVVWLVWGAVGAAAMMFKSGEAASAGQALFIWLGLLVVALGGAYKVILAYDISRRYVPGKVLVMKTMIMAYRAATSQTNYADARVEAEKFQKEVIREKPWWFYSYDKPPRQG